MLLRLFTPHPAQVPRLVSSLDLPSGMLPGLPVYDVYPTYTSPVDCMSYVYCESSARATLLLG